MVSLVFGEIIDSGCGSSNTDAVNQMPTVSADLVKKPFKTMDDSESKHELPDLRSHINKFSAKTKLVLIGYEDFDTDT